MLLGVDVAASVVYLSNIFSFHLSLLSAMRLGNVSKLERHHLELFGMDTLLTELFKSLLFCLEPSIPPSAGWRMEHSLTSQLRRVKNLPEFLLYAEELKSSLPRMDQPMILENGRKRIHSDSVVNFSEAKRKCSVDDVVELIEDDEPVEDEKSPPPAATFSDSEEDFGTTLNRIVQQEDISNITHWTLFTYNILDELG